MVAAEVQEVAQDFGNWSESEQDHARRVNGYHERLSERTRFPHRDLTVGEVHDLRHALEAYHRFSLAHKTRYSAIPGSVTNNGRWDFNPDEAALQLAVAFKDGVFAAMTFGEYARALRFKKMRDNDRCAESQVAHWSASRFPTYLVAKRALFVTDERPSLAAKEWTADNATLIREPRIVAQQLHKGMKAITAALYDGDTLVAEERGDLYSLAFTSGMRWVTFGGFTFTECPSGALSSHLSANRIAFPQRLRFCVVDADALKAALPVVEKARSNDHTRPVLTYLCLSQDKNGCNLVATDTYRLFIAPIPCSAPEDGTELLVNADALRSSLDGLAGQVALAWDDKNLYLSADYASGVQIAREEGQFVNWRKVVPASYDDRAVFDAKVLAKALKEVGEFAREDDNRVVFRCREGVVSLSASQEGREWDATTNRYVSTSKTTCVEVPCEADGDWEIAFNFRYVLDFIGKMKGEVELKLRGALSSAAWVQGNLTGILMPMQIV